jgi:hypothetical protein
MTKTTSTQWRKSSRSGTTENTSCVELSVRGRAIGIRDSRAPEAGHLSLVPVSFADLVNRIKAGELDL